MNFDKNMLCGVYKISLPYSQDDRGSFSKVFHSELAENVLGYAPVFRESFFTKSYKGVIRGMHFQLPPSDLDKLVYVSEGEIMDVVLDLRKGKTYGKYITEVLSYTNHTALFIPKGLAHGFLTLSETAVVHYLTTEVYNQECDYGISWDSFGYDWEKIDSPIISERDKKHDKFISFKTPF